MNAQAQPHLLTTKEAADLLRVSPRTVLNWIDQDLVPYVALPSRGRREYRIPRRALLRALSANYDLAKEFSEADQVALDVSSQSHAAQA
jgi:excisionase family DNA binding protein